MARAHGQLGQVDAAIDAASAAVVTWGEDEGNRQQAIAALHAVLSVVEDLSGYVGRWDAKVEESGLDAPVIRKQCGKVFLERQDFAAAVAQLLLARELQPLDNEVHGLLVQGLDGMNDGAGAIAAMRQAVAMSPMDLDLYLQLARRLQQSDDSVGAERAYTSMVEVQPHEAESHRKLAEVRGNQKRHEDAVEQWKQVVRVRRLEADGWLRLAQSQIDARQFDGAAESLSHVLETRWLDDREDAYKRARVLQQVLRDRRG
jgi:tetratricopeptide (TPR) repeat protein